MNKGTAYVDATGSLQGAKANSHQRHFDTSLPRHTADLYYYRSGPSILSVLQTDTAEGLIEAESNGEQTPWHPFRQAPLRRLVLLGLDHLETVKAA